MRVYELVFLKATGVETRYTDREPSVGEAIRVDGRAAVVVSRLRDSVGPAPTPRYVCSFERAYLAT